MIDGNTVKALREKQGLTLRDVAERVWCQGVSLSAERIRQIEEGGQNVMWNKGAALAAALGTTMDAINGPING